MQKLPIQELQVFDAIVREGGVRAASRALGIAHSAVSRRLGLLETFVGEALVERTRGNTRGALALTPRGSALAGLVRASFGEIEAALQTQVGVTRVETVVVSTTSALASRWLLPRLSDFKASHPRTDVSMRISRDLVCPGNDGVDIALRMGQGPWPGTMALEWMDETLVPLVSPVLLKSKRTPLPLKALVESPLLEDGDPETTWARWAEDIGPKSLRARKTQIFDSSDLLVQAAAQGLGVALVRARLAQAELQSGALVPAFGPYQIHLPKAYWIVMPKPQGKRPAVQRFVRWLMKEAT